MASKYEVTVKEKKGSCDNELFEKMAKKGDITSVKLAEVVNQFVTLNGYAKCTIKTDDKEFDVFYLDTEEYGLISSGSEIFANSVIDYYGEVNRLRLSEVKTKKGKTYKAVPVLSGKKEETQNDLPF